MKRTLCVLSVLLLLPLFATAGSFDVNCDLPGKAGKISETLRQMDPMGPNTVVIHGQCRENIVINGFDRLTLRAAAGATLSDASGGADWAVVLVVNSRRIRLRGLNITGGTVGVVCSDYSFCDLANDTFEGQTQNGISINDSEVIIAGDTVRNVQGPGIFLNRSKSQVRNVTSEHNRTGITISAGTAVAENVSASNNTEAGFFVSSSAHVQLIDSTANNSQIGIQATGNTSLSLVNDTAMNNSMNGVWLSDLTSAFFSGGTYLNNGGPESNQVECAPYYSVASNLGSTTTGATNCPVPH